MWDVVKRKGHIQSKETRKSVIESGCVLITLCGEVQWAKIAEMVEAL